MNQIVLPPIYEDADFLVEQSSECPLPGYCIVHLKQPCTSLATLTNKLASRLMFMLQSVQQAVQEIIQPEKIYLCSFCELNPQLRLLGIVPSKVSKRGYQNYEKRSLDFLRQQSSNFWNSGPGFRVFEQTPILQKAAIAESSGSNISFFQNNPEVKMMFELLGGQIAMELGWGDEVEKAKLKVLAGE